MIKNKAKFRRQPEYGKLVNTLNSKFHVMLFTESFYEIGKGTHGKCYLAKLCDG